MPKKPEILYKTVTELMARHHEDNPRVHGWDADLPKLVRSLLFSGWCELPSYNENNDRLIGGHGRVMAAEWMIQQTKAWYEEQWQSYLAVNPRGSKKDRERFDAGYWLKVPVRVNRLDDSLHKAMMVRLNNPTSRGRTKEDMRTLLLSRLTPAAQDIAIPDPERRSRLLGAIATKRAEGADAEVIEQQEQAEGMARVQESLAGFVPQEPSDAPPSAFAPVANPQTSADLDAAIDPEPVIEEGGAHYNEDPEPGKKKAIAYPLAIVLSNRRWQEFEAYKAAIGVVSDQVAFLKGHVVFNQKEEEGDE
ncbi:MAG: hypothetical protein KME15_20030 [Drouetiella hepatica Uher 2000/2452]|jgi:hypothetical protein|uniref:Uncharacterized protein n=1 Tax=Drouetiella hepatica Uher 2000/2452 TaxID=904376 RepID=A0A951QE44_9CYAN|nr:hypothetical protein [Drouetiella hepatica Uher 2000/2452]